MRKLYNFKTEKYSRFLIFWITNMAVIVNSSYHNAWISIMWQDNKKRVNIWQETNMCAVRVCKTTGIQLFVTWYDMLWHAQLPVWFESQFEHVLLPEKVYNNGL